MRLDILVIFKSYEDQRWINLQGIKKKRSIFKQY